MIIFWIGLGYILSTFSKAEIHLFTNHYHCSFCDIFFKIITNIGNGLFPVALGIVLLLFCIRKGLIVGIASTLAGILSQIFKRLVFPDEPRPLLFFENISNIYIVPGVEMHSHHSFPSGHTATAFSIFFVLSFFTKSVPLKILCLLVALLVGFSRIYLSQHFLADVYFGAIIGISAGIFSVWYMNRYSNSKLDMPLIKI